MINLLRVISVAVLMFYCVLSVFWGDEGSLLPDRQTVFRHRPSTFPYRRLLAIRSDLARG